MPDPAIPPPSAADLARGLLGVLDKARAASDQAFRDAAPDQKQCCNAVRLAESNVWLCGEEFACALLD